MITLGPGIDVTATNPHNRIMLDGIYEAPQDGDRMIEFTPEEIQFKEYQAATDKWILTGATTSRATLKAGRQVGYGDSGTFPAFRIYKEGEVFFIPPANGVNSDGSQMELLSIRAVGTKAVEEIFDGTTDIPGVLDVSDDLYKSSSSYPVSDNGFVYNQLLKVGDTNPTAPVRYRVYEDTGPGNVDKLMVEQWIPESLWDGKVAGDKITFGVTAAGDTIPIGGTAGENYYTEWASSAPFSMYGVGSNVYDGIDVQRWEADLVTLDRPVEISSETTHEASSTYMVDTTSGVVDIIIPYTFGADIVGKVYPSFTVRDAKKMFQTNNCRVLFKNDVGATTHTVSLDKINQSYFFYRNDTGWNYGKVRRGEIKAITNVTHSAAADFKDHEHVKFSLSSEETVPLNNDGVTWTKITNMTICGSDSPGFSCASGTLTKTTDDCAFLFNGTSDLSAAKAGTIYYGLHVNGAVVPTEITEHTFTSAAKVENISITSIAELSKDDTIELYAKGDGVAVNNSITIKKLDTTFWGI